MSKKHKNSIIYIVVIAAFFIQVIRGFHPEPLPGEIPGGAANAPIAVVTSAVLAGILVWVLLEAIFWLVSKIKNTKNR